MATFAQVKSERQRALREVRRRERQLDTDIERMERRIFRLLDRKTILQTKDASNLSTYYATLVQDMRALEQGLRDFYSVVIG